MGEICENCGLPVSDTAAGCENPEVSIPDTVTTRGQDILAEPRPSGWRKRPKTSTSRSRPNCGNCSIIDCENGGVALKDQGTVGSVRIPDDAKYIDYAGFAGCKKVTEVIIPNGVAGIGDAAFSNWIGLTSITIPNSVTEIGEYAFYGCTGLTSITFTGTKAQWRAIYRGKWWKASTGSFTVHCTDGDISKSDA